MGTRPKARGKSSYRKTLEMFSLTFAGEPILSLSLSFSHTQQTYTHIHRSLSMSSPFQRLLRDPLGSAAKSRTTTLSFRNRCERYALIGLIGFTSVHMSFDKCTAHHRLPSLTTAYHCLPPLHPHRLPPFSTVPHPPSPPTITVNVTANVTANVYRISLRRNGCVRRLGGRPVRRCIVWHVWQVHPIHHHRHRPRPHHRHRRRRRRRHIPACRRRRRP